MKNVYVLVVSFPDEDTGGESSFEMVVSAHATHELAVAAGELYTSPFEVKEVSFYE